MTDLNSRKIISDLIDSLQWFVDDDFSIEGSDCMITENGGETWTEVNEDWIKSQGLKVIERAREFLSSP